MSCKRIRILGNKIAIRILISFQISKYSFYKYFNTGGLITTRSALLLGRVETYDHMLRIRSDYELMP